VTEERVPVDLARLWQLPSSGPRLGRPAELDVEQVVSTAVELADRDGVSGVTLLKVAQMLGYTKMALYRHVGSKDELLELMVDRATGPAPDLAGGEWRCGVRQWAVALRAVYAAHPWLTQLPISGPPRGPNEIAWLDALLRAMRDTGLDARTKLGISTALSGYVYQASAMERQLEAGARNAGLSRDQVEQNYGRLMTRMIDPQRFPDAAELFAAEPLAPGMSDDATPGDQDFTFGLELILDGIALAITSRAP
jgi:AcrR family transcriptional regulator